MRFLLSALCLLFAPPARAEPAFREAFAPACVADNPAWRVSSGLRKDESWPARFSCAEGAVTITVKPGDAYDSNPGSNPTERAEIETTRSSIVTFDKPVWYAFSFRVEAPWRTGGNRTVIHQVKQNIATEFNLDVTPGAPCEAANPFFRLQVRELHGVLGFRADAAESAGCPSETGRHAICTHVPVTTGEWHRVHVALRPGTASGLARVWLDGVACGAYRGPFGFPRYGVRRDGKPFIDTPPRFGLYRDAAPVEQAISFKGLAFWTAPPEGEPEWIGIAPLAID